MQQAYSAIRIISEAQTVRIVLSTQPGDLMLKELAAACASFGSPGSEGIKAIVLDFTHSRLEDATSHNSSPAHAERAYHAVRAVAQPVLAVVRDTLSPVASGLLAAADFTLVNEDAMLSIAAAQEGKDGEASQASEDSKQDAETETLQGALAARMGYVTWAAGAGDLNREMERILNTLREKSPAALRLAKAGARLGQAEQAKQVTPLEALQLINKLYLAEVMQSQDASEGLHAFLEKRKPAWKNR